MANIPIAKPLFGPEEIAASAKPLESGWIVQGPHVAEFERRFGAFVGTPHAVACSNGTTALHLANAAMRLSITTGEGGMVTWSRADVAAAVRSMRDHGAATRRDEPSFLLPDYDELGFNYRLTDLQGAIGCVQLDRAEHILGQRRLRARIYDEKLASLDWLRTPVVPRHMEHGYQAYGCLFAPAEPSIANVDALEARRNALMARLEERGIATRQGTHAPVLRAYYRHKLGVDATAFPNAVLAEKLSFALPLYPQMTDEEQDRVVHALREIGPC